RARASFSPNRTACRANASDELSAGKHRTSGVRVFLTYTMTRPAARFVRVERPDLDRLAFERRGLAVHEPLRHRRRTAAAVAHRLELVDELGDAEQRRHRAERQPAEVLCEPCRHDA